jgi:polyhydroxyalkanoate synthesis regulator phasin
MNKTIARIEAVKDLIQEAVDKGATSVEQVHRTIADLPLSALERHGLLGEEGRSARTLVDSSIGAVYQTIRAVNREVGELASALFEALENHADADAHLRDSDTRDG